MEIHRGHPEEVIAFFFFNLTTEGMEWSGGQGTG